MKKREIRTMNLSFAGCGFTGMYYVGVVACLRRYAPHLYLDKVSGTSAGAIAAAFLICNTPLDKVATGILNLIEAVRTKPASSLKEHVREMMTALLGEDAHIICSGRLHISVTDVLTHKNVILSEFQTKEELVDAVCCTAFLPGVGGLLPPKYRGRRYMDGGYSTNILVLDEHTIRVSPFSGYSDICPSDEFSQHTFHVDCSSMSFQVSAKNMVRLANSMFAPGPEVSTEFGHQGFADALRFLLKRNLVYCKSCVSLPDLISQLPESCRPSSSECGSCEDEFQKACEDRLPEQIAEVLEQAMKAPKTSLPLYTSITESALKGLLSIPIPPWQLGTNSPLGMVLELVYARLATATFSRMNRTMEFLLRSSPVSSVFRYAEEILGSRGSDYGFVIPDWARVSTGELSKSRCEVQNKRICIHISESHDDLIDAVNKSEVVVAVYYRRRFNPASTEVRSMKNTSLDSSGL